MHEQYIQQSLTTILTDPFHGPARNIMNALEISFRIIDGLLQAKQTGKKLYLEFVKNPVTYHNTSSFQTIKKSGITHKEEKKKTTKVISVLKEDLQALGLFVAKCTGKKAKPNNGVHIYDGIAIVRSVASQKTWGDYL